MPVRVLPAPVLAPVSLAWFWAPRPVQNQANKDSFQLLQERLDCCCEKQAAALECERKERRCADDIIVNYVNSTFYPRMTAEVTTGTTTTAQPVRNPLPACSCNCGR